MRRPTPRKIRTLLRAAGLSQSQGAEALGVSTSAVKKWLTADPELRREMPQAAFEMLQLLANEHPEYRPVKRRKR